MDTYHIAGGLVGEFDWNSTTWYWDVGASWSQNQANQRKAGAFNARKLSIAVGDPAICAVNPGCVPFNWFGGQGPDCQGSITQEMLDYVTFIQKDESEQEMFDVSANISGEFGSLPAGPIGVALGFEYRDEEGLFVPDSVVSSGETAGVPSSPTAGSFDVTELYGEVIVPVVESLDLSAALRYSDYDRTGSTSVGKLGLNWRPIDDLHVRANFSEGFRAPNIGELFNTGSRFDAAITDPWDADAIAAAVAAGNTTIQANCLALGVPVGSQQLNPQISVSTGGNLSLTPEESETFTVGLTWDATGIANSMSAVASTTFEANYYDITVDSAIQAPDAGEVLLQCALTLDPFFCDNVTRVGATVTRIDGILLNIGSIETSGFDWTIGVDFEPMRFGEFRARWSNTHLIDYIETTAGPDGPVSVDRAGTELGSPERGYVEWKSSFIVDWLMNDWTVSLNNRYISEITEECTGTVADFELTDLCTTPTTNKLKSKIYTDAQVTWKPEANDHWTIQAGIQNLFGAGTPICYSCDLNSFDGTLYPIPGRFWFTRLSYSR